MKTRPTDVIISPYNKSGTTWVQPIEPALGFSSYQPLIEAL